MIKILKEHYREAYSRKGKLETMYGTSLKYLKENNSGDIEKWSNAFVTEIKRIMIEKGVITTTNIDLKNIHKHTSQEMIDFDGIDGTSALGRMFYKTDSQFINNYHNFIKWLSEEVLDFDFYFQATPTIRFNCAGAFLKIPNTKMPYPRYHTDLEYGHPPQEINLWWSFTDNFQSGFEVASFSESKKWYSTYDFDLEKFTKDSWSNNEDFNNHGKLISSEVKSKKILIFDARCIHSAIERKDMSTRVSLDIRINPVVDFVWPSIAGNPVYVGKGRTKAEFKPGGHRGYYSKPASEIK